MRLQTVLRGRAKKCCILALVPTNTDGHRNLLEGAYRYPGVGLLFNQKTAGHDFVMMGMGLQAFVSSSTRMRHEGGKVNVFVPLHLSPFLRIARRPIRNIDGRSQMTR